MKKTLSLVTGITLLAALASCDDGSKAQERTEEIENFAEPVIESYEEALEVQSILDEDEAKKREAIDQGL